MPRNHIAVTGSADLVQLAVPATAFVKVDVDVRVANYQSGTIESTINNARRAAAVRDSAGLSLHPLFDSNHSDVFARTFE